MHIRFSAENKKKKKINIFLFTLLRTGGIRVLLEYADNLSGMGYDVVVYTTLLPYSHYEKGRISLRMIKLRERLYHLIKQKENINKYQSVNFRFKIKTIPFISSIFVRKSDYSLFTYWPIAFRLKKIINDPMSVIYLIQAYETWDASLDLLHSSFSLGFKNVATSEFIKKTVAEKSGAASVVLNDGVNTEFFFNSDKKYDSETITIGFINYASEFKGSRLIAEALNLIRVEFGDKVRFVSFGIVPFEHKIEEIEYHVNPDDSEIRRIYSSSDIFISASFEEGFYLVPAEAMACKCASVITNVGAVGTLFKNGRSAVIVPPRDLDALVSGIRSLILDNLFRKNLSENGCLEVREKLNWSKVMEKFEQIIKE